MGADTDRSIIEEIEARGIDANRLSGCLNERDNWGGMVHAYEYLTVLSVVSIAMREAANDPK